MSADALAPLGGYPGDEDQAHRARFFPGTQHGFNNDTTPRYDEAAARQAWARTLERFERTLR
ncbi:MAG: dienelactone hydrolase family protein [Rubrivivax sp.]|nr:dienelactone hydrolase family protein [Rubrivivax sp.]